MKTAPFRCGFWLAVFLMAVATSASASARVVAGKSLGQWKLGAVVPAIKGSTPADKALKPHWIDWVARAHSGAVVWPDAFVVPDSRLKKLKFSVICISNADFKTASGISTASNFAQIKRAFPALKLAATYTNPSLGTVGVYDSIAKGIAFEMLLDKKTRKPGRCLVVSVHYPKRSIFSALKLYPSFGKTLRAAK